MNFDNPIYKRTTEDKLELPRHEYQPSQTEPSVSIKHHNRVADTFLKKIITSGLSHLLTALMVYRIIGLYYDTLA